MAHAYRDLFEVHLKYAEFVRSKSLLVHQYLHNITTTGSSVEVELRQLLRGILPSRFKVTHGYIVAAPNRVEEPRVSPAVDILIVDTLVPHSLFLVDDTNGMELVPIEAVVGIIEVKRTLSFAALTEAINHLKNVRDAVGLDKSTTIQYLPGGVQLGDVFQSPYRSNPLLGILSVDADAAFVENPVLAVVRTNGIAGLPTSPDALELDFVASLSGILMTTAEPNNEPVTSAFVANPRLKETLYPWVTTSPKHGHEPRLALALMFGFVLAYLSNCCGRAVPIENYFFNVTIA